MRNLPWLPWLLVAFTLVGGWFFRHRAPAVGLGLVGLLVGGFVGHRAAHGVNVPSTVGAAALMGLSLFGAVGLAITPTATSTYLRRASALALVGGVIAVRITWTLMHDWSCYFYDPPDRLWCGSLDSSDLFYGISGEVTVEVAVGATILAVLFFAQSWIKKSTREGVSVVM